MARHTSRQLTLDQSRFDDFGGTDHTDDDSTDDAGWDPGYDEYGPTMERRDPLFATAASDEWQFSVSKLLRRRRAVAWGLDPAWLDSLRKPERGHSTDTEARLANEHTKHTHTTSVYPIDATTSDR